MKAKHSNLRLFELFVFPLDDVHCGYGTQQGNLLPALPCIPGRVMRGGLAGWALRNSCVSSANDDLFKSLFTSEGAATVSFPFCTLQGRFPVPLSLFEVKGGRTDPAFSRLLPSQRPFVSEQANLHPLPDQPLDFLLRKEWPSDVEATLKPKSGSADVYGVIWPPFETRIEMKAHHENTGRVGKEGLFAEGVIPAALSTKPNEFWYRGTLVIDSDFSGLFERLLIAEATISDSSIPDQIEELFKKAEEHTASEQFAPKHLVFLGHRRVPCLVYAVECDAEPFKQTNGSFTITFTTDFIPECSPAYPLTAQMVQDALPGSVIKKKERVFCRRGEAHGYDITQKALDPMQTLAAGSCGHFKGNPGEQLQRSLLGIGRNSKDGFGRFILNWDIHNIQKVTDDGQESDG